MTTDVEKPKVVRFLCCWKKMPFKLVTDEEGFIVCPEHEQRRYGWRSPRVGVTRNRPNFGETRLEQDQDFVRELFGR